MSEAAENNEVVEDIDAEITEDNEIQSQPTAEDVAREGGWRPLDEWDGPPGDWRSAEVFNERGDWIKKHRAQDKRLNDMESQFNSRLDNSNKLHKAQLDQQKADLVRRRDEAIDLADKETALKAQEEIDNIVIPMDAPQVNSDQAYLDEWNQKNQWILQNTPKAIYAKSQFNLYQDSGQDSKTALANAERDIKREFPEINPGINRQPTPEGGSKPGSKRSQKALTMNDLTQEEASIYKKMPGTWATDKDFLKAVQDSRS
jgi:hypothetical protein